MPALNPGYAAAKTTLTIKPINYGVVQISWDAVKDSSLPGLNGSIGNTFPKFTLVRKASGYPQGIADGTVIRSVNNLDPSISPYTYSSLGVLANYFVFDAGNTQYTELNPPAYGTTSTDIQGTTMYYALFLSWPDTGSIPFRNQKVAEAKGIFVKDNGTLQTMLDHLPSLYKKDVSGNENQDLESFLSLFAFHYDLYRTQATTVFNATNPTTTDVEFLKKLLNQFGGSYGDIQDPSLARNVLENIVYLSKSKGTLQGIEEFIKSYTGYVPTITSGKNLMHDYNSSSFEENTGFWWPVSAYSGTGKTSDITHAGPRETGVSIIQPYSNRQGVTLTNASGSGTIITVTSTAGLNPGSLLEITGGSGVLPKGTAVERIISSTTFRLNRTPTTPLSGATIIASDNMITGMMRLKPTLAGNKEIYFGPKISDYVSGTGTTVFIQPAIAEIGDYAISDKLPYGTYVTVATAGSNQITLSAPPNTAFTGGDTLWFSKTAFDKAGASTAYLPVSAAGEPHTFSIRVNNAGSTPRDVDLVLKWKDVNGTTISSSTTVTLTIADQTPTPPATTTDSWYLLTATDIAPAGAIYCAPHITVKSLGANQSYFFDAAQWERGVEVYSYGFSSGVATVVTKKPHGFTKEHTLPNGGSVAHKVAITGLNVQTINSVPTPTSFTYNTGAPDLTASILNCSSSGQLITIPQTPVANIAIGATVTVTSGTGAFAANTVIVDVLNEYTIYVDKVPTTPLSGATIQLSQVAVATMSPSVRKASSVTEFEDAKLTYIDIAGTQINEVTDPTYWHSTTSKSSFTTTAASLEPTTAAGTVTFSFTGASGAFGAVSDTFNNPIQITQATGSGNTITYTTSGVHDFLVGKTPTVYNMANFFSSDPANAGRGNGFDIKQVNAASVPIVSVTDTTFTVQKAPITLTGVTSYVAPTTNAPYIVVSGANYDQLWVGAKVRVISGTGNLSLLSGSAITTSIVKNAYNPATSRNDIFYLDVTPSTALVGATIEASLGSGGLSSTSLGSGLPTAIASYDISYSKGRNIYYNNQSAVFGNFSGINVDTGVSYTFAMSKYHTLPTGGGYGYQTYSPYIGSYLYSGFMCLPYIEFNNGVTNTSKAPMAALVRKISRKNNVTTFTTSGPHNFKVGDLIHFSNVKVTPTGLSQINYSHDSVSATTTGVPHYVQSVTPTSFSTRHAYAASPSSPITYSYDGVNFAETLVDLVPAVGGGFNPPLAGYAVTNYVPQDNYMSMTAYPYAPRTTVAWDVDDSEFHRAIPGFYLVELFGTPSSQPNHTVTVSKTFFSVGTDFQYFFDGINDPNNRIGGYLDTLWEGTPGSSRSHYYLNLASTSNRLQSILANVVPYGNGKIDFPNKTVRITQAKTFDAISQDITFYCIPDSPHDFALNSTVSITDFVTYPAALNFNQGQLVNNSSNLSFTVRRNQNISGPLIESATAVAYATNGWSGLYRIRYADPSYTSPYSTAFGFTFSIFTLDSSLLDGTDTLTY